MATAPPAPRPARFTLALLLAGWVVFSAAGQSLERTGAVGVRALDGDTIKVRMNDGRLDTVRLLGVDCPERGQELGTEARRFSHSRVAGRVVRLVTGPVRRDHFGRLLAFVEIDGHCLNEQLAHQGLAVVVIVPPNTDRTDTLLAAQAEAHRHRLGVWGAGGPALEPRGFREAARNPAQTPFRPLRYEHFLVTGNARSGVAHWPGCRHVDRIARENRRLFPSVAEAQAAGYRMERQTR